MRKAIFMIPILTSGFTAIANAEDKDAPTPPFWKSEVELGSVTTTGNTDTSSTNAGLKTKRKGLEWDFTYELQGLTSEEDGVKSKEKYNTLAQFDRNFTDTTYMAIRGDYEKDRFSGYDYQATASVGLGYRLLKKTNMELDIEGAPGYRRDKVEDEDATEEGMFRLTGNFRWEVAPTTALTQKLETELSENNTVYRSESSLQSQISGRLATKLSYTTEYTEEVPEDTKQQDSEFSVTLVYGF